MKTISNEKEYNETLRELASVWDKLDTFSIDSDEHHYYNGLIDAMLEWEDSDEQ